MRTGKQRFTELIFMGGLVGLGFLLGAWIRDYPAASRAELPANAAGAGATETAKAPKATYTAAKSSGDTYLRQSQGAQVDRGNNDWGLGTGHVSKLLPYPMPCREGDRTPF